MAFRYLFTKKLNLYIMEILNKKPFKRKHKGAVLALFIVLACFSCKKDDVGLLIDITGEPDMVIENRLGKLYYEKRLNMIGIDIFPPPGEIRIDGGEYHMIVEMPYNLPIKKGEQVSVSGLCYRIPPLKYRNYIKDEIAGNTYYYIKVTNINYQ